MRLLRVSASEGLLRIALGFAFLYPAIHAFFDPTTWLGYFPPFVTQAFDIIAVPLKLSDVVLLHSFGFLEIILAVWVLFGKRVRTPALIMAVLLFAIVGFNLGPANFSVLFRDVSIAFAAIALALGSRVKAPTPETPHG
jgi:uncharacterized membrane protein YphA (DoxX/SURF4 family)